MRTIVRTKTGLLTDTVSRQAQSFDVVVNGNYFDATYAAQFRALDGRDPIDASSTYIEGRVFEPGKAIVGDSHPERYYIEEIAERGVAGRPGKLRYITGLGDPPISPNTVTAIGNLRPLISANLPHGKENQYQKGKTGPITGDPGAKARAGLTQRSNKNFASAEDRPATTGKTVIAYHARLQALLVGVQPDGQAPGQSYAAIRNGLRAAGFSDAVFLDGSDSAMLWHRGRCVVKPGEDKNQLMTVGLGFVQRNRPGK